jgi:uncharacterized protein with PQ loop repeat
MAPTGLALAASSWGVLMGIAPVLQIHRMLREQSSRDLSLGYCAVLLIGFLLWIAYGLTMGNFALVIPNGVALAVGTALMLVALRLRRPLARPTRPWADHRARFWRTRSGRERSGRERSGTHVG